MNSLQIASNEHFQAYALQEALHLLSKDTGISVESLYKQFPTNENLQKTCAEIVAKVAQSLAEIM